MYAVKLSDCQMLSNLFVLRELLCELRKCILKKSDLIPQFVLAFHLRFHFDKDHRYMPSFQDKDLFLYQ